MSELKEHIFSDIDEVFPRGYCGPLPSQEARPYYLKSEADKVFAAKDKAISELKEAQRWRKFPDEKPTEEMEGMDFIVSNGFFHREISEWRGYWNNDPFCGDRHCDEVKYWRPLPAEPKEEK